MELFGIPLIMLSGAVGSLAILTGFALPHVMPLIKKGSKKSKKTVLGAPSGKISNGLWLVLGALGLSAFVGAVSGDLMGIPVLGNLIIFGVGTIVSVGYGASGNHFFRGFLKELGLIDL